MGTCNLVIVSLFCFTKMNLRGSRSKWQCDQICAKFYHFAKTLGDFVEVYFVFLKLFEPTQAIIQLGQMFIENVHISSRWWWTTRFEKHFQLFVLFNFAKCKTVKNCTSFIWTNKFCKIGLSGGQYRVQILWKERK